MSNKLVISTEHEKYVSMPVQLGKCEDKSNLIFDRPTYPTELQKCAQSFNME